MRIHPTKSLKPSTLALSLLLASATVVEAQRLTLPAGSVILVRTQSALESATAKVGQTFETTVIDTVRVDDYTVIPSGSRIRGVVTYAKSADRQNSGVVQVSFDRLTLTDGSALALRGRLTSTDTAERRQIEQDPNARVVLVGGRGGIGAAIAGAGSANRPASGILAALGNLLSEAQDVRVEAGTPLAVQLEQRLVLNRRGSRVADANSIYTAEQLVRSAQQRLAQQNYYRGPVNGQLNDATRRALFEYQSDNGLSATGNLDFRTAQSLGIAGTEAVAGTAVMSAEEASQLRRTAQALVGRHRQDIAISTDGRLDSRRSYVEADVDLWFALSAFADNASLYEQLVRASGNTEGSAVAGKSLISAARRVDTAMQAARTTQQTQNTWAAIRSTLAGLDQNYR